MRHGEIFLNTAAATAQQPYNAVARQLIHFIYINNHDCP